MGLFNGIAGVFGGLLGTVGNFFGIGTSPSIKEMAPTEEDFQQLKTWTNKFTMIDPKLIESIEKTMHNLEDIYVGRDIEQLEQMKTELKPGNTGVV